MITGAAQANCGILVIDVAQTQFERGWEAHKGTTKEHAMLARSLGVTQLIVALNKMEKIDFSTRKNPNYSLTKLRNKSNILQQSKYRNLEI